MLVKFEQTRMVWTIQNFELFDQKKKKKTRLTIFWQSIDAILKDVSVTETIIWCLTINLKTTIFQCSKNYGSPTRVTRLKVAPNMSNPIKDVNVGLNGPPWTIHKYVF